MYYVIEYIQKNIVRNGTTKEGDKFTLHLMYNTTCGFAGNDLNYVLKSGIACTFIFNLLRGAVF